MLVASHSWGDNVFRAFMQWADSVEAGWVERHIATYVNIAGPVLGVPKSIPAFLSGPPPFSAVRCQYIQDQYI